jgi:hypothetical protein
VGWVEERSLLLVEMRRRGENGMWEIVLVIVSESLYFVLLVWIGGFAVVVFFLIIG